MEIEIWVETKNGWTKAEHGSWTEVLNDGWQFIYADPDGTITMERNGYLNRWKATGVR